MNSKLIYLQNRFAGVAQRQRNGFVNHGLEVRFLSPASFNAIDWAGTQVAKGGRLCKRSALAKAGVEK